MNTPETLQEKLARIVMQISFCPLPYRSNEVQEQTAGQQAEAKLEHVVAPDDVMVIEALIEFHNARHRRADGWYMLTKSEVLEDIYAWYISNFWGDTLGKITAYNAAVKWLQQHPYHVPHLLKEIPTRGLQTP